MASPKRKPGARPNSKGRNDAEPQYVPIPYLMAHSPAWRSLGGSAIKVWIELRSRFNGHNNGKLSLGLDEAARLLSMSKATAHRALLELEEKGFLMMTKRGVWHGRMATEWAVTDRSQNGQLPTRAWRQWRPTKTRKI